MSSHIRRILLAKSIIDARNVRYIRKLEHHRCCKSTSGRTDTSKRNIMKNVIEALTNDTKHHPADFIKMYLWPKSSKQKNNNRQNSRNSRQSKNESDHLCSEEIGTIICGNAMVQKFSDLRLLKSINQPQSTHLAEQINSIDEFDSSFKKLNWRPNRQNASCHHKRNARYPLKRYEGSIASEFPVEVINACSKPSNSTSNIPDCPGYKDLNVYMGGEVEDQKYAKFIYNITQEIIQKSLYSDKELDQVFKKHIEMNKHILNINKMQYEIYQLETSLNVPSDSDADEELKQLIKAQKSLTICEDKQSTVQKLSDDGKTNDVDGMPISASGNSRDGIAQTESCNLGVLLLDNYTEPLPPMLSRLYQEHCVTHHGLNAFDGGMSLCVPADTTYLRLGKLPLAMKTSRKYTGKSVRMSQLSLIDELRSTCNNRMMKLGKTETLTIKTLLPNGSLADPNKCTEMMEKIAFKGHMTKQFAHKSKRDSTSHIRYNKNTGKAPQEINVIACPNYTDGRLCKLTTLQKCNLYTKQEGSKVGQMSSKPLKHVRVKTGEEKSCKLKQIKHAALQDENQVLVGSYELKEVVRDETKSEKTEEKEMNNPTDIWYTPPKKETKDDL